MNKLKENSGLLILTSAVVLVPALIGLLFWKRLPEQMPTHWSFSTEPDGYSSRAFAVFGLPLILLAGHLFCAVVTCVDGKSQNIGPKMFRIILWSCPALSIYLTILMYGTVFSLNINANRITMIFLGIMFAALGNYLPKCRQNHTVGIRIPWTLHDEQNWNRTHHFAGRLWMIGGILLVLNAFIVAKENWGLFILCIIIVLLILLPIAYSLIYCLKHKA